MSSPLLKMILYSPINIVSTLNLWNRRRVHKKNPDSAPRQRHNDLILGLSSRLLRIYNIKVKVVNRENLIKAPALIVSNHVNNLDVFALMQAMKKQTPDKSINHNMISFVAKIELRKKKIVRNAVDLLDGVFIDRDKPLSAWKTIKKFAAMLKEEKKIGVIFPEGTRGNGQELGQFKLGAFKVARINLLPIIPVTINNSQVGFSRKTKKKQTVEVIFHKPIKLQQILAMNEEELAKNVRSIINQSFKRKEVNHE